MTAQPHQNSFRQRLRRLRCRRTVPAPARARPERRDCQSRLVVQLLARLGAGWSLADAALRPWCSATFVGAQHRLTLRYDGDHAIDRALAQSETLPDLEFRVAGHVVADLAVEAVRETAPGTAWLNLALLTVEDW